MEKFQILTPPQCLGLQFSEARLIQTRLIQSSTLFRITMKRFPIIFLSFHAKNALLIRSST